MDQRANPASEPGSDTPPAVFKQRPGTGFGHNVNYAPVSLGPDGTAYVGVLGGLVRIVGAP